MFKLIWECFVGALSGAILGVIMVILTVATNPWIGVLLPLSLVLIVAWTFKPNRNEVERLFEIYKEKQ